MCSSASNATAGIASHRHPAGRQPSGNTRYIRRHMPTATRATDNVLPLWMAPAPDNDPPTCHLSVLEAQMLRAYLGRYSFPIVEELPDREVLSALGKDGRVAVRHDASAKNDMRKCAEKFLALAFWGGVWQGRMAELAQKLRELADSEPVPLTRAGAVYLWEKLNRSRENPPIGLPELDELAQMPEDTAVTLTLCSVNRNWLSYKMAGFPEKWCRTCGFYRTSLRCGKCAEPICPSCAPERHLCEEGCVEENESSDK